MLKTESKRRLWTRATLDILYGGCSALVKANRMQQGSQAGIEAQAIVSEVYSGSAVKENPFEKRACKWCGADFVPDESDSYIFCSLDCQEIHYQ